MVTHVTTAAGKVAAVLDENDLSEAKSLIIKWLLGILASAIAIAVSFGMYVANANAKDRSQDVERATIRATADSNRAALRQLDSLRIETRHIGENVQAINAKLDRALR